MERLSVRRSAAVAVVALAVVLGALAPARAGTVRDMTGREVHLAAAPRRIVSLVPSVTEILFALGSDDRLVGVTDFCDFPPDARSKPSVGGMINPSLETIVTLRPDLVIATTEGSREETFSQLRRLGIPTFLVVAHRLGDAARVIERLGHLTGRPDAASTTVRTLERRIQAVRKAVAARPRPRVLYVLWPEPLIVPGRDALVTELIQAAGGDSITATEGQAYPRLSLEAAVALNPEVIVLASHGPRSGPVEPERWARLGNVAAVRAGRLHTVDGNIMHRYGPRVVEGLEALARIIHPEAYR